MLISGQFTTACEGWQGGPRKGRCRTFDSYCYTSSSLLLALKMQTQSSPSLESNLNCFWTAPIVLVGTGSPAKKGQVCFLSIPPCWGKGGSVENVGMSKK